MISNLNKKLLFLLLLVFSAVLSAAEKPVVLDFSSRCTPGMKFFFNARNIRTRNCEMRILGLDRMPCRRDTSETLTAGTLCFLGKNGDTENYTYRISALQGNINGEQLEFPELSGRTVSVTAGAAGQTVLKLIPESTGADETESVLGTGPEDPLKPAVLNKLPEKAAFLLRGVFTGQSSGVANYFGKRREMIRGKHDRLDITPLLYVLQQRGIPADKGNVEAFCELAGSTVFYGLPVHRVNLVAQGRSIPGYDFKFEVSLFLPDQKHAGTGPYRISRKVMEVVNRLMPDDSIMTAGGKFEIVSNDFSDIVIIPENRMPGK